MKGLWKVIPFCVSNYYDFTGCRDFDGSSLDQHWFRNTRCRLHLFGPHRIYGAVLLGFLLTQQDH